jgi:hypothetical protein
MGNACERSKSLFAQQAAKDLLHLNSWVYTRRDSLPEINFSRPWNRVIMTRPNIAIEIGLIELFRVNEEEGSDTE